MRINTNVSSLTAQEAAQNTSKRITSSLEKLSTGLRINKASDDASGLAIADKLRTQATSINQGISNGNSAVSLLQIADKSMAEQSNILDTIKSKLIQANTDTTSSDGRESIRKDIAKLLEQLDNIAEQTNYNGNVLLQKSSTSTDTSTSLSFQVGETSRDIITNTSIQSNTNGLGSKVSYGTGTTLSDTTTKTFSSSSSITISASGTTSAENVKLSGDVDLLDLDKGAKLSNVDTATQAKLDGNSNVTKSSSGVYTVNTSFQLDLSTIDNVQMDIKNPASTQFSTTSVSVGQVVDVRNVTLASGSDLKTSLNDSNLFTKLSTGIYVAVGATTIDELKTGESFKLMTTTNVESGSGSTQFSAGDQIKVTSKVSGSLLDNALGDSNMFKEVSTGVYTVLKDYTAGSLRLMSGESIDVTQGSAVTLGSAGASSGHYSTGLKISSIKYNPGGDTAKATNAFQSTAGFGDLQLKNGTSTGTKLYAAGEDNIKFTITASGGATRTFNVKAGDIISGITETSGHGLSSGVFSTDNFVVIASGVYQAITGNSLTMDGTDSIKVTRLVGGVSTPTTHSFDADNLSEKKLTSTPEDIVFTTGKGVDVTNNTGTNDVLKVTSATELTNGKDNLSALKGLTEGELTAEKASGFQSVIDDSITKLNGYRGDIGSTQNQVESAVRNLMTQATNVKAAESIIRDVDYAAESANFNKQNIISQAGSYAISQANTVQQNVLKLLQ
jgi:flagellin